MTRALVDPHPALKAASPQATCADMFVGDDWHHNGAFRLSYSFDWIGAMETERKPQGSAALDALGATTATSNFSRSARCRT